MLQNLIRTRYCFVQFLFCALFFIIKNNLFASGAGIKQMFKFFQFIFVFAAKALLPSAPSEPPYEGAKEMLLVEDVDD